jgi:hypothetical protein
VDKVSIVAEEALLQFTLDSRNDGGSPSSGKT